MAFEEKLDTNLRLVYADGVNEFGEPQYKAKGYNNIKPEAATEEVLQVAKAIASLSNLSLHSIERQDRTQIVE